MVTHRLQERAKQVADDFHVLEDTAFASDGDGEYLLVQVHKHDCNTSFMAKVLATLARISAHVVSYMSLKDRHAVIE